MQNLLSLAGLFLKLGIIGFGGPAVHIGLLEKEVVQRRGWLTQQQFLDLLGVTNLIPGPNSTEMAIHVGYRRAGFPGLVVAGVSFILPAALITLGFAWVYKEYGTQPQVLRLLHGITPAVLAIILAAIWRLGRTAVKNLRLLGVALGVAIASLLGADQVLALLIGTLAGTLLLGWRRPDSDRALLAAAPMLAATGLLQSARAAPVATGSIAGGAAIAGVAAAVPLWKLALFFLKVGAVLYGGGYVLIAYLDGGLVHDFHWLTQQQLLDAVAVGQFTPGPILSTATFVGYLIAGTPGAIVATLGIFLPSFVFVAAVSPFVARLRRSYWASMLLDAVNVASIGLMGAVMVVLTRTTLLRDLDWRAWLIAGTAAAVTLRWKKVAPAWLVLGGAIAGGLLYR